MENVGEVGVGDQRFRTLPLLRKEQAFLSTEPAELDETMEQGDAPEWLLDEILLRLPVESVFRFKSVSKRWLLRFSEPSFIQWYTSHRSRTAPAWTLLYSYTRVPDDIPDKMKFKLQDCPLPRFTLFSSPPILGNLRILGSSSGLLLCCQQFNKDMYYIHNPLTRQWLALPPVKSSIHPAREGLITRVKGGQVESYKVVRMGQNPESPSQLLVDVFSSESCSWMNYQISSPCTDEFPKPFPCFRFARPVTLNETVYMTDYQEGIIMAYNPYKDPSNLSFIQLPERETERLPSWFELCELSGERLRHYVVSEPWGNPTLKVWELCGVEDATPKWLLVHSCRWSEIQSEDAVVAACLSGNESHRSLLPLSFHPTDPDVMYLWNAKFLASYRMQARRLELFCELDSTIRGLSWDSVMPFVFPTWPASASLAA